MPAVNYTVLPTEEFAERLNPMLWFYHPIIIGKEGGRNS